MRVLVGTWNVNGQAPTDEDVGGTYRECRGEERTKSTIQETIYCLLLKIHFIFVLICSIVSMVVAARHFTGYVRHWLSRNRRFDCNECVCEKNFDS